MSTSDMELLQDRLNCNLIANLKEPTESIREWATAVHNNKNNVDGQLLLKYDVWKFLIFIFIFYF